MRSTIVLAVSRYVGADINVDFSQLISQLNSADVSVFVVDQTDIFSHIMAHFVHYRSGATFV